MRCSWLAFRLCRTGSGLDHLRQLYAPQRSWAGLKKASGPAGRGRLRRSAPAVACAATSGVLVSTAGPVRAAAPRPSTRRGRRDSQRSACASSGCRPVVSSKTTYACRGCGPRVPYRRPAARQRPPSRACHTTLRLLDRQSLGRPALVTSGRPDQRCHVPVRQIVGFGMSDTSHEAVVRNLQRPRRQLLAQRSQRRSDLRRR